MSSVYSKLFDDNLIIKRVKNKLPHLFQLAELESSRNGKIGMEIGSVRERILIALLMYKFGIDIVDPDIPITASEVDVIVDNTPEFLWSFLGFITLSIYGFILSKVYKESYPVRAKAAKKGAIAFLITLGSCIVIYVLYIILNAFGKIV